MVPKETQVLVAQSIGDVAGPETAKEKLKRKLLQKKDDRAEILESWLREILAANLVGEILDLNLEHSPFESSDENATPGRVLVLYPSEKHTYDLLSMLTALGVYSVRYMNM